VPRQGFPAHVLPLPMIIIIDPRSCVQYDRASMVLLSKSLGHTAQHGAAEQVTQHSMVLLSKSLQVCIRLSCHAQAR
jgi:hypothetical protein